MEQVTQRHGMNPTVRGPPTIRDKARRNGRQSEEPLRNVKPGATATVATEQQRHGRTATHANVATASERNSHLPATAATDARTAATATDAVAATSATTMG